MPIKVVGLLHAGVRIPPGDDDVTKACAFYGDLLGLEVDAERGHIPGIPSFSGMDLAPCKRHAMKSERKANGT